VRRVVYKQMRHWRQANRLEDEIVRGDVESKLNRTLAKHNVWFELHSTGT